MISKVEEIRLEYLSCGHLHYHTDLMPAWRNGQTCSACGQTAVMIYFERRFVWVAD